MTDVISPSLAELDDRESHLVRAVVAAATQLKGEASLVGSRAYGGYRDGSDVDLIIVLPDSASASEVDAMRRDLKAEYGRLLPPASRVAYPKIAYRSMLEVHMALECAQFGHCYHQDRLTLTEDSLTAVGSRMPEPVQVASAIRVTARWLTACLLSLAAGVGDPAGQLSLRVGEVGRACRALHLLEYGRWASAYDAVFAEMDGVLPHTAPILRRGYATAAHGGLLRISARELAEFIVEAVGCLLLRGTSDEDVGYLASPGEIVPLWPDRPAPVTSRWRIVDERTLIDDLPVGTPPAMPASLVRFVVPTRFSALQTLSYGAYNRMNFQDEFELAEGPAKQAKAQRSREWEIRRVRALRALGLDPDQRHDWFCMARGGAEQTLVEARRIEEMTTEWQMSN